MLTYAIETEDDGTANTLEVPDGKWVAKAVSSTVNYYYDDEMLDPESEERRSEVVGPQPQCYTLDHETWRNTGVSGWKTTSLFVGDEPFGLVTTDTWEGDGLHFTSAQQVWKGELSKGIRVKRPSIVRSASRYPAGNHSQRRRKQARWMLLSELAKLAGLPPLEVVVCYFAFTDQCEPQLHIVQGDDARVKSQEWHRVSCERIRARELTDERWASLDPAQTWVRVGWATRVLQMRALGHTPACTLFIPIAA